MLNSNGNVIGIIKYFLYFVTSCSTACELDIRDQGVNTNDTCLDRFPIKKTAISATNIHSVSVFSYSWSWTPLAFSRLSSNGRFARILSKWEASAHPHLPKPQSPEVLIRKKEWNDWHSNMENPRNVKHDLLKWSTYIWWVEVFIWKNDSRWWWCLSFSHRDVQVTRH